MHSLQRTVSRRFWFLFISLVGFLIGVVGLSSASAQAPARRLTTTGDVLEFVWSPEGEALYATREGKRVEFDASRRQIAGDLYRVMAGDGAGELLARNANWTRAPITGDEIAFARVKQDGTARAVIYNLPAKQERDVGEIQWGAPAQWNREGGIVFLLKDGKMRRTTRTERGTAFAGREFPENARVSPSGDRVAYVDEGGLWVTQGDAPENYARVQDDTSVSPQFAWSNAGDAVAFLVTHKGFDPEVWVADTARHTTTRLVKSKEQEYFANPAWSPDGAFVIFTRTPTGSSSTNHSEIWRARADGSGARALTHNNAEEALPQYAPDGRAIAFLRAGDLWVLELNGEGLPQADPGVRDEGAQELGRDYRTPRVPEGQRTPPATIRVRHDAANACRSAPVGQIDVIDFETYVKRVVPAEVFPSWDDDALKTQAVAARSYAWFWILQHGAIEYDVTDTTAYQYMCDTRYATTDNATEVTRGQYLDYAGYMVFAAYGAENGDPTVANTWGNPYLLAVDDPVGFMRTRAGNGLGYSQRGAQRWATQYDWNYQQILRHYYSNVTLEVPAGSGNDATPPAGAIVSPRNHWGITSSRVHLVVNASDDAAGIASIELKAQYNLGGAQNQTIATLNGSAREFTWDVAALPNQTNIVVTPILHDANGNTSTGASITFDLDRKRPQGTLSAPATTTNQTITLNLNASDAGGSALTGMMFSNDWEWQGESQNVDGNSGSVVGDADALNGSALRGLVGTNAAGTWYGPYTSALTVNQAYRAYFRIKTDNVGTSEEIALLDVVTDGGANLLGMKSIRGVDLQTANTYQEFYVDFYYTGFSTLGAEFRLAFRGTASVWLDRILVVEYPVAYATTAEWTLPAGEGNKRILSKFLDGAGNVSQDATATVFYGENPPPTLEPRRWLPFIVREK